MNAFKFVKYGVFISLSDTKPVLSKPVLSASCVYPHHTLSCLSLSLTHTHKHTHTAAIGLTGKLVVVSPAIAFRMRIFDDRWLWKIIEE
jgi:hypothetical protein